MFTVANLLFAVNKGRKCCPTFQVNPVLLIKGQHIDLYMSNSSKVLYLWIAKDFDNAC